MKQGTLFLAYLICLISSVWAQPASKTRTEKTVNPMTRTTGEIRIVVYERGANLRLEGVAVTVRQLGMQEQQTGMDGKVLFRGMPIGESNFTIEREGYERIDTVFTVSANTGDNTYSVFLSKARTKKNSLMITGEVEDERGRDVKEASVEIAIGEYKNAMQTDQSGSYKFEINLAQLEFDVHDIRFEVKKNGCIYKDRLQIPKSNTLIKDVRLQCQDEAVNLPVGTKKKEDATTGDSRSGNNKLKPTGVKQEINGVSIKLLSARYSPGYIQCNFEVENVSEDFDQINFGFSNWEQSGKINGTNGYEYFTSAISIAGGQFSVFNNITVLYKSAPVKIAIRYDATNKPRINTIAMLNQSVSINNEEYFIKITGVNCTE
jgi:hypothetical protein